MNEQIDPRLVQHLEALQDHEVVEAVIAFHLDRTQVVGAEATAQAILDQVSAWKPARHRRRQREMSRTGLHVALDCLVRNCEDQHRFTHYLPLPLVDRHSSSIGRYCPATSFFSIRSAKTVGL